MTDADLRERRPMVAFLFPGQGAEVPGMGLDLASSCPEAAALLERASEEIGRDALSLLRRADPSLRRTEVLQPVLASVSLGAFIALEQRGARPDVVAGHSLGELVAFGAAGAFTHKASIHIAAVRGSSMAREAERRPGGMLALIGCDERGARDAVALGLEHGALDVAAHNAPDEWVVAGDDAALSVIASRYSSRRLPVSGAWHGRTMAGAEPRLRDVLKAHVSWPSPSTPASELPPPSAETPARARDWDSSRRPPIVSGCTGRALVEAVDVPSFLASQLTRTVRWADVIWTLAKMGVTDVITVGPGRALRGLVRKNGWSVRVHGTENTKDLSRTVADLVRAR